MKREKRPMRAGDWLFIFSAVPFSAEWGGVGLFIAFAAGWIVNMLDEDS